MTVDNFDRPIPDSYWVIPGRLLAGEYPGSFDPETSRDRINSFLRAGFDTFINLTQPDELDPYEEILHTQAVVYGMAADHLRFPIRDRGLPSSVGMSAILDAIDQSLATGRKVYIHCWGGVGRTGTAVGCYLRRHGHTGRAAVDQLAGWWQDVPKSLVYIRSPETNEQVQFILDWSE
jgi:hypothetical protein